MMQKIELTYVVTSVNISFYWSYALIFFSLFTLHIKLWYPSSCINTSMLRYSLTYLSTPVLMHGGLLCITFCLSVWCHWTKKLLVANNSRILAIANCNSRVKSISHVTGRCALFNVKLHFFISKWYFQFPVLLPHYQGSNLLIIRNSGTSKNSGGLVNSIQTFQMEKCHKINNNGPIYKI